MRALVLLVQLLVWLLAIRLVFRGLARLVGGGARGPRAAPRAEAPRAMEDLVLDRVCRTHLPRSRALTTRIAGREEHFCSAACRDRALAAVARAS